MILLVYLSLSACAAPIIIGSEIVKPASRSTAFAAYPDVDVGRCAALSTDDAITLYPIILDTGRCNPNNHHPHDHEINRSHHHEEDRPHL